MTLRALIVSVGVAVLSALVVPVHVAATPPGLRINPAIEQLTFQPQQTEASFDVTISNDSLTLTTVAVGVQDFAGSDAHGALQFMAEDHPDLQHGLRRALHPDVSLLVIPANGSLSTTIHVTNDPNLAPGGHYAGVIFRSVDPRPTGDNTVGLQPAVSVLVFMQTAGVGTQQLRLVPPLADVSCTTFPAVLPIVIRNDGNTQSVPRGTARVYGIHGEVVAQSLLNIDSSLVLPGSQRLFETSLSRPTSPWPGLYRIVVQYRADGQMITQTREFYFIYLPIWVTIALVTVIVGGLLGLHQCRRRRAVVTRSRRF